ncbi:MAG: type II CAAX endopeptidase family protein [Pseudomonadota bacterium]
MRESPAYARHKQLVDPARSHPQLWRMLLGCGLIGVIVFALNALMFAGVTFARPAEGIDMFLSGRSPTGLVVVLYSFAFVVLAVALALRVFHHRSLRALLGPLPLAVRQFAGVSVRLAALAALLLALPPYALDAPLEPNLTFGKWLIFLPLALGGLFVQTGAEEVLFRGYLQQSLAARFRNPVVWIGMPSVLFGLGHYLPSQAGDNAWLIVVWSGFFGVLMADLTARAGTLGPAIALHFFNNIVALVFIALPGGLDGLALYHLPYEMSDTGPLRAWLAVDFALMLIGWLIARITIRR